MERTFENSFPLRQSPVLVFELEFTKDNCNSILVCFPCLEQETLQFGDGLTKLGSTLIDIYVRSHFEKLRVG